jgi:hypothetical protein
VAVMWVNFALFVFNLYCGGFILFCNACVCVCVNFVMTEVLLNLCLDFVKAEVFLT